MNKQIRENSHDKSTLVNSDCPYWFQGRAWLTQLGCWSKKDVVDVYAEVLVDVCSRILMSVLVTVVVNVLTRIEL